MSRVSRRVLDRWRAAWRSVLPAAAAATWEIAGRLLSQALLTPALAQPPLRHNSVDGAPPEAALLPTSAFGFFGWPALADHRDGRDWTLLFAGCTVEECPGATVLRATDDAAGLELALQLASTAYGV